MFSVAWLAAELGMIEFWAASRFERQLELFIVLLASRNSLFSLTVESNGM